VAAESSPLPAQTPPEIDCNEDDEVLNAGDEVEDMEANEDDIIGSLGNTFEGRDVSWEIIVWE